MSIAWDVQIGGDDTNGGGFLFGAAGTNRSLTLLPFVNIDNVAITATVAAATITFTAGYIPTAADVGNVVNVISSVGGTPPTFARYKINAVGATTWILDRTTGAVGATITSAKMGGCFLTIQAGLNATNSGITGEDGDSVFVKYSATPYAHTTALTMPAATNSLQECRLTGYLATHDDNPIGTNRPVIQTGAAVNGITLARTGWIVSNLILDGNSLTGTIGFSVTAGSAQTIYNVLIQNYSSNGISSASSGGSGINCVYCEISGCGAAGFTGSNPADLVSSCYIHNNVTNGVRFGGNFGSILVGSIVANNGAIGVSVAANTVRIMGNLIYGNGTSGISIASSVESQAIISNNILAKNGTFGLLFAAGLSWKTIPYVNYNGYWSNTSGTVSNVNQGANDVVIAGTDPTNDPFVAKGATPPDWRLNNIDGAGALFRAVGLFGLPPGLTALGYRDLGPYQHQDSPSNVFIIDD
jgi:hypothetical protein